jgi:drug/metabolite transporter (DMT)-like permease
MRLKDCAFPLGAVLIWSGNTVVSKLAVGAIEPAAISFYRWLLAGLVLTPFLLAPAWSNRRAIRPFLPRLAVLGLLGMVLYQSLSYFAAASTSATNMGLILSLMPLLTILLSAFALAELPSRGTLWGGLLSLAGILFLVSKGQPSVLLSQGIVFGDGLMLLATLAYAAYSVLLRKWSLPLPAWQSLYLQIWIGVALLFPDYWMAPPSPITAANLPLILFAGIAASVISGILWMRGIERLGANRTSIFMNLIPVFTPLIAILVLNETLHDYHVIGGAITLCGVLMSQARRRPDLRKSASADDG